MKRTVALIVIFLTTSLFAQSANFDLRLKVHNPPPSMKVLLKKYNLAQNVQPLIDTLALDADNFFHQKLQVEPGIYQLHFTGLAKVPLPVVQNGLMGVVVDNRVKSGPEIFHSGGVLADMIQEYEYFRKKTFARLVTPEQKKLEKALSDTSDLDPAQITSEKDRQAEKYRQELADFAAQYLKKSVVFLYATLRMDERHLGLMKEQLAWFRENMPDFDHLDELEAKIKTLEKLATGAVAPEITLPDPQGEMHSLSGLRGKYVLLDFWASWCLPCRRENPFYAELYNRYKKDGFDIFSVGLETNKTLWEQAIKRDGMTWTQVSDLEGWGSAAAAEYNVTSIPANFLIDPQGRIIARDLRGSRLEEKLRELFE